jgi:ankyrin repeat protein
MDASAVLATAVLFYAAAASAQTVPTHPPAQEGVQPKAPHPALEKILAAQRGETPEVDALVRGKDPNARDTVHQRTALMWTIVRDDTANFDRFMAAGADVNAKDAEGSTPLLVAAELAMKHDTTAMAEALVAKGADVAARPGGQGLTPLMHAANGNAPGVAQAILSKLDAKDVDVRTGDGMTALSIAAAVGASDVVEMLLAKGAQVDGRDKRDKTPLMHAAGHSFPGTVPTVTLLLGKGADVNARDKEGRTPLSAAKQSGPPELAEMLRKAGAR